MKKYLHSKGISWEPTSTAVEDWEEGEEDGGEYKAGDDEIENMIADLLKQSVTKGKKDAKGHTPSEPPSEIPTGEGGDTSTPKTFSLPPMGDIKVRKLEFSDSWSPTASTGGTKDGTSSWTPPSPPDDQWQREVGEHGEEIIYRQELNRARAMGYPESRVVWVAKENPATDFDILSVDDDGEDLWIEVKSTTGRGGRFRWPKAEFVKAIEKRNRYILWRVYEADTTTPSIKPFRDPVGILLRQGMRLDIDTFYVLVEPM